MPDRADVVVVGGGLVGATVALDLRRRGFDVVVVEARPPVPEPAGPAGGGAEPFDLRVSAISLGAQRYLDRLGVWARLPAARIGVFRAMHVWDASSAGVIDFSVADLGVPAPPALGYIVENRRLEDALERELGAAGVRWSRPARVLGLEPVAAGIRVVLADRTLEAGIAVGADGTGSTVRALAGIEARLSSYPQHAVVAAVRTERGHEDTAWQRFLTDGPLALLPLPDRNGSIVWSTREDEAVRLQGLSADAFAGELERALGRRFGAVEWVGARGSFPLRRARVARYVTERVALVGDAAHTIHPLAGQGVNLGFLDAATLAHVLGTAGARGCDPGRGSVLRRYERWRKAHNAFVEAAMDGLNWLFLQPDPRWRGARGAGLRITDRIGPLKRQIMRLAMGLGGDLPPGFEAPPAVVGAAAAGLPGAGPGRGRRSERPVPGGALRDPGPSV